MSKIEKALNKTKKELVKKREYEANHATDGATNPEKSVAQNNTEDELLKDPSKKKGHQNIRDLKLNKRELNITYAVENKENKISENHESINNNKISSSFCVTKNSFATKGREIRKDQKTGHVNENIVSYYDFLGKQTWEGPVMVCFRRLQVSLKNILQTDRSKVLVISSAVQNEGKSITAVNIAISLCNNNTRVVLVDCDIRKPTVHKMLGFVPDSGLSDYLSGKTGIENCSYNGLIPGLTVIPAGSKSSNVCELLESGRKKQLITELRNHFDYVIIDTPPILSFPDTSIISPLSDGVVLVVNCKFTKKSIAKRAVEALHDCRVIGCIMNESVMQEHSNYHHYY